jgi:hypothetical protein
MCCNAIARNEESNLHFFINSTTAIGRIARYGKLPYELVKTVCREDEENIEKLGGLPIFAPTGQPRKINFYTSTAFEGCDIYDPQGKIFIVSDRFIKHSMLDVSTSIRQIAGRIRNTEYKEITHIFSKSPYAREVTYEQFKTATEKEVDRAQRWERHRDTADEDLRKSIHTDMRYINPTTQKYDNNIPKLDMMNYRN